MITKKDNGTKQGKLNPKINIQTKGHGLNFLIIHGSPGSMKQLVNFQKFFASSFTVTILDRPGHGLSPRKDCISGFFDEVDFLGDPFFENGKEPMVLCGHSYGAALAMALAVVHHKRVSHLVLISPPPFDLLQLKHVNSLQLLLARIIHFPFFKFFFNRIIGPILAPRISGELVGTFFSEHYVKASTPSFLEFKNYLTDPQVLSIAVLELLRLYKALPNLRDMTSRIQCPTLIVLGENDDRPYFEHAKNLQATWKDCSISEIKNSKHYPHMEQPKETFLTIADFLEKTGAHLARNN